MASHPISVLAGRGSDEGIDLIVRAFCRAGQDSVLICPPTFGMYKVSARIQGAGVVEVPLLKEQTDSRSTSRAYSPHGTDSVKIVFLCTPNNPTGNLLERAAIERLCCELARRAVVVVDEAYVEFARVESLRRSWRASRISSCCERFRRPMRSPVPAAAL